MNISSQQEDNELDPYWSNLRKKNFDSSFPGVASWINASEASVHTQRLKKRFKKRFRWSLAAMVFVLFIFSCTYRVERTEKYGDLVNFSIVKQDSLSLLKLGSLRDLFSFKFLQFQPPGQENILSFISFIKGSDDKKVRSLRKELNSLKSITDLDIAPVEYTVKESLFLSFVHNTLNMGEAPRPKPGEVKNNIREKLEDKGFDYITIEINESRDEPMFSTVNLESDTTINSSTLFPATDSIQTEKAPEVQADKNDQRSALEKFNWLLGTWQLKYMENHTHHYWVKVNDSSYKCFVIEVTKDLKTNMTVGFTLKLQKDGNLVLGLKGSQWKFIYSSAGEFLFRNGLEKDPDIKWTLKEDRKSWQSVKSGPGNAEFITLTKEETNKFEKMVKDFGKQHPDIYD